MKGQRKRQQYDVTDNIIKYEQGDLTEEETFILFQYLVDTGMVWTLQGSYGRTAQHLIDAGYVHTKTDGH